MSKPTLIVVTPLATPTVMQMAAGDEADVLYVHPTDEALARWLNGEAPLAEDDA